MFGKGRVPIRSEGSYGAIELFHLPWAEPEQSGTWLLLSGQVLCPLGGLTPPASP